MPERRHEERTHDISDHGSQCGAQCTDEHDQRHPLRLCDPQGNHREIYRQRDKAAFENGDAEERPQSVGALAGRHEALGDPGPGRGLDICLSVGHLWIPGSDARGAHFDVTQHADQALDILDFLAGLASEVGIGRVHPTTKRIGIFADDLLQGQI